MDAQQTIATVSPPAFEAAMRQKAKDILSTLANLEVEASPVNFTVDDVTIAMTWGSETIEFNIGEVFNITLPLPWITDSA